MLNHNLTQIHRIFTAIVCHKSFDDTKPIAQRVDCLIELSNMGLPLPHTEFLSIVATTNVITLDRRTG